MWEGLWTRIVTGIQTTMIPINLGLVLIGCFVGSFIVMMPGLGSITAVVLMIYDGSMSFLWERPSTLCINLITMVFLASPIVQWLWGLRRRSNPLAATPEVEQVR